MKKYLLLVLAFALIATSCFGAFRSGNELLRNCESQSPNEVFFCNGYVLAVHDASQDFTPEGYGPYICLPVNVTVEQVKRVIVKFLNDNPSSLHYSASSLASTALQKSFPCPANK